MPSDYRPEPAPLLAPGRHLKTLSGLQILCLDGFAPPTTRDAILAAIELLIADLTQWGVCCQVWVSGYFLTTEQSPEVAEIAVVIEQEVLELLDLSLRNDILTNMDERSYNVSLDVIVIGAKNRGDPDYAFIQSFLDDWIALRVVNRSGWVNGLAIIWLGETDVGLRLLS